MNNSSIPRNRPGLPKKPYTPVKPRGAKSMTIAAGFVCANGVVLGADTELTFTTSKANEGKIFEINPYHGCYVTYSGDSYAAKDLIARVTPQTQHYSPDECLAVIQAEYRNTIQIEMKKKNPDERSWFELLVTIRRDVREPFKAKLNDYRTSLYHLHGDRTLPIDRYVVIGIGQEFALSIFERRYQCLTTLECAYILIDAIRQVKKSVQACGGSTNIVEIPDNGERPYENFGKLEIEQIEKECEFIEGLLNPLLLAFPSPMAGENFEKTMDWLTNRLRLRRAERGLS
jgi:20S proteasome alpha/beta subunit